MGIAGLGAAITTSPGSGMQERWRLRLRRWLGSVGCGLGATGSGLASAGLGAGIDSGGGGLDLWFRRRHGLGLLARSVFAAPGIAMVA